MAPRIPDSELKADLLRVYQELGRSPTVTEYDRLGSHSSITVRRWLGNHSWSAALESLGLEPASSRNRWSDKELQDELDRLRSFLGHRPSYAEIRKYSKIHPDTFLRRIDKRKIYDPSRPPLNPDWSVEKISEEDGFWISGFFTGEGSFVVRQNGHLNFRIGLRVDDQEILFWIRDTLDLPYDIYQYSNKKRRDKGQNVGDEVRLSVSNRWVLRERIVPFFNQFPPRGRRALEYPIFREAVLFLCQRDEEGRFKTRYTAEEKAKLKDWSMAIKALRRVDHASYE